METLEIKPKLVTTFKQLGVKSATPTRPAIHDFKKVREAYISSRNQTPKSERNLVIDTLSQINLIQEELKHRKTPDKVKSSDLKLVFCKDTRPRSAFKGGEDNQELIKIAESTANLFKSKRGASGRIEIGSRKNLRLVDTEESMGGSATQRAINSKISNKVPKPVFKGANLLRKYLKN